MTSHPQLQPCHVSTCHGFFPSPLDFFSFICLTSFCSPQLSLLEKRLSLNTLLLFYPSPLTFEQVCAFRCKRFHVYRQIGLRAIIHARLPATARDAKVTLAVCYKIIMCLSCVGGRSVHTCCSSVAEWMKHKGLVPIIAATNSWLKAEGMLWWKIFMSHCLVGNWRKKHFFHFMSKRSRLITKARGSVVTDDHKVMLYEMAFCDSASVASKMRSVR